MRADVSTGGEPRSLAWLVRLCVAVLGACAGAVPAAEQADVHESWFAGVYGQARAEALSNGLPVMDIDGDWQRGYKRRGNGSTQRAYQAVAAEAGVLINVPWRLARGPWALGWGARAEAFVRASGDAAEVVQFYQARRDPPGAVAFEPHADVMLWRGQGPTLQTPWLPAGIGEWQAGMQWLTLQRLRRVGADGELIYDGAGEYEHQLSLSDDDNRTDAPFTASPASRGGGYSLSVAWRWQPAPDWSLRVDARDVASQLWWKGVNTSRATLTSRVSSRNADGYLDYQPALQGAYTRRTLRMRIPGSVQADLAWRSEMGAWRLNLNRRWGLQQTWLGWESAGPLRLGALVEPRLKALRLQVEHGGFTAGIQADRTDRAAHVASLWLGYAYER